MQIGQSDQAFNLGSLRIVRVRTQSSVQKNKNMKESNEKKKQQLGMHIGTASAQLRKNILFDLLKQLNKNFCHQCNKEIQTVKELSIEHITPYLDSDDPKKLFFDLNNIAFSHLKCNSGAARQTKKTKHPSWHSYKKGCRCNECKKINADRVFRYRNKLN